MIDPKDQADLKKLIRFLRDEPGDLPTSLKELREDTGIHPKRAKSLVIKYPKVLRKYTKIWWEYGEAGYSKNVTGDDRTPATRIQAQLFPAKENPYPKEENVEEVVNSWKNYLTEVAEDPSYDQNVFDSYWHVRIAKGTGGDKAQTQNEIRSIPNVTTVSAEGKFNETGNSFVGVFKIKFALERPEQKRTYIDEVLKPGLKKIKGMTIMGLKGIEQIK